MLPLHIWGHAAVVLATFLTIALGAKTVVDSAGHLAERAGLSELVIGLTVVAFGTSAPEFGVTLIAAFEGRAGISVGNIVGSNIFNLGFILGGAALVRAIPTDREIVWRDTSILVASTLLLLGLVSWDLRLGHVDGWILMACLVGYLTWVWRQRKNGVIQPGSDALPSDPQGTIWKDMALLALGLTIVWVSAHFLVESASSLARSFGVTEWVIAVTIIAAGTSVPELATTMAGVVRGRTAISAGNVIGSDIFNLLGVLGVAGIMQNLELQPVARGSLMALSGMAILVLLMMRTGWRLSRSEGFLLVLVALLRWGLDFATRV